MAKTSFDSFKDLDLTRDEIDRIGEALKDKEFRKLFSDYVTEVNDPANRLIFEKELTQLERERGVDVTFINPQPGYVIKTSMNGSKKAFVNVCSSDRIGQPTSKPTFQDGAKGLQWSLPHSLAPPREDFDNKKILCQVFDVVFHPDTLHLALKNPAFKNMVNRTACDAVENSFDCKLDQKNLKFPNLKFKGVARPTIIRKQMEATPKKCTTEESDIMDKIFEQMPKVQEAQKPKPPRTRKNSTDDKDKSKYATPKYEIKHRSHIELENFTYDRNSKMSAAIPKELVVEICLPLLKAATDIDLDVTEKTVQLKSETPAKYKLSITLPYKVNETSGSAKFDKDTKKLIVTLPVQKKVTRVVGDYAREDSGVESDHGSISPPREKVATPPPDSEKTFLDTNIEYTLPEYTCHLCENLIYTLAVKNVQESTLQKVFNDANTALHIKFTSISAGHFPVHYAFCVKLPTHFVNPDDTTIETWDNNVVVQIAFTPCDWKPTLYMVGTSEDNMEEQHLDEKQQVEQLELLDEDDDDPDELEQLNETVQEVLEKPQVQKANRIVDTVDLNPEPKTKAIDIFGSGYSESSGDEMSCSSYSPKCKGILKRMSVSSRSSVSRSVSESSVDDFTWASSFENCYSVSQDSVIHEEDTEPSTSLKKTVRFSNHVLRQLFRSNSSILGQKKKNQRKNRNKKRANERRHSESELSEGEKERETKTDNFKKPPTDGDNNLEECKKDENIFPLDM